MLTGVDLDGDGDVGLRGRPHEPQANAAREEMHEHVVQAGVRATSATSAAFLHHCKAANAPKSKRLVLIDVGANDGAWSEKMMRDCSAALRQRSSEGDQHSISLHLIMFEPNPILGDKLALVQQQASLLVPPWTTMWIPAAVWTVANETKEFWVSNFSIVSSFRQANANRFAAHSGAAHKVTVETIELGAFLRSNVSPSDISFMKLDIECVEWVVIPHLLDTRALCLLDLIRVEWHFKSRCPGLNASTFRDFGPTLHHECNDKRAGLRAPMYDFESDSGR